MHITAKEDVGLQTDTKKLKSVMGKVGKYPTSGTFPLISIVIVFLIGWIVEVTAAATEPVYGSFATEQLANPQTQIYLTASANEEIVVTSASHHILPQDYLTHVNGIKILSGGLAAFLRNGEKEAVIPVIDDEDEREGGSRLLGFIKLIPFTPTEKFDISYRRGDIDYDGSETVFSGPSIAAVVAGGGGHCITGRDCFFHNGTCVEGSCVCPAAQRGAHCQVRLRDDQLQAERAHLEVVRLEKEKTEEAERRRVLQEEEAARQRKLREDEEERQRLVERARQEEEQRRQEEERRRVEEEKRQEALRTEAAQRKRDEEARRHEDESKRKEAEIRQKEEEERSRQARAEEEALKLKRRQRQEKESADHAKQAAEGAAQAAEAAAAASQSTTAPAGSTEGTSPPPKPKAKVKVKAKSKVKPSAGDGSSEAAPHEPPPVESVQVEDLYGVGKRYPPPYDAGRSPNNHVHERHMRQRAGLSFVYSVRFRMGPYGFAFDNKEPNGTIVERVIGRSQAEQSDIRRGDRLIAASTFDTYTATAKVTQRILATLEWPVTLAFETKAVPADPSLLVEAEIKKRTKLLHIIYPPTLTTLPPARVIVSDWTPDIPLHANSTDLPGGGEGQQCPIYVVRAAADIVGCAVNEEEFQLPPAVVGLREGGVGQAALPEAEATHPMLSMLHQKSTPDKGIEVRPMAIMKRGVCTFVDKAKGLARGGARLGLVVNTEGASVVDMPSGKEDTAPCTVPLAMVSEDNGALLQIAASYGEVLAILGDAEDGPSPACQQALAIASGVVDRWPHSVPAISTADILQAQPPAEIRSGAEEGGRMALSGENGWVYFDYHLAMFGGKVPEGPLRLQMAFPPFGCDPAAYTVRIKGAAVAILRGGGCSFGIKVINAQKLGAAAVIIVNTDDKKTMRLMALADEVR